MDPSIIAYRRAIALQKIVDVATPLAEAAGDPEKTAAVITLRERAREMSFAPRDEMRAMRVLEATAAMIESLAQQPAS